MKVKISLGIKYGLIILTFLYLTSCQTIKSPTTVAGDFTKDIIKLTHTGNRSSIEEYIQENYYPDFIKRKSLDKHIQDILGIHNISSDFKTKHIINSTETVLDILLYSAKKDKWVNMRLEVEQYDQDKINWIGFSEISSPFLTNETDGISENLYPMEQIKIIETINNLLLEFYIFADVAALAGDYLIYQYISGSYVDKNSIESFAESISKDLMKITQDKHLGLFKRLDNETIRNLESKNRLGFIEAKILTDNIGYIYLRSFPDPLNSSEIENIVVQEMKKIENTDAIIFDLRENYGGQPNGVQYFCSYLFDEIVHLNSIYVRETDFTYEYWTHDSIKGKKLPNIPVYVLTSNNTFSGAEEFAYNLQTRKRAVIIGETTLGGAHPAKIFYILDNLVLKLPIARAINPITNTNWEGTGVIPDITVKEEDALETALMNIKGITPN